MGKFNGLTIETKSREYNGKFIVLKTQIPAEWYDNPNQILADLIASQREQRDIIEKRFSKIRNGK